MANEPAADGLMRLNRFLARAGVASRRSSEALITAGRVAVNGVIANELGTKIDPVHDTVTLDGTPVVLETASSLILLNKPAGVYTTMDDPQGRSCVADYVDRQQFPGLYHIGRLDRDTTGLLLFSNDGQLGNQLMHPAHHVDKTYLAQVEGTPTATQIRRLNDGIDIKVGGKIRRTAPAEVRVLSRSELDALDFDIRQSCLEPRRKGTSIVEVIIQQGMKHQVKLMLGAVGHHVVNLHRLAFGRLNVGEQKLGTWRTLTAEEVTRLYEDAGLDSIQIS